MAAMPEPNRIQLLQVLRRRRLPMILALGVAIIGTVVTAFVWPATYVSTGTILIQQQEVPVDLVRSTISSFADQRIQMINQRVMTSDNLMGIVQKYNLYEKLRRTRGRETILDRIRSDIHFGSIKASVIDPRQGKPVEATIAFSLSYQSRSPEIAARVANELSSLYLQENLESRKRLTDQAAGFLGDEGDKLSTRIVELEAQMADFKERNANNLPELTGMNLQLVSRADDDKRDVDTQIRSLDQQITFLEAQLGQISKTSQIYTSTGERVLGPADRLKLLRSEYARVSAIYASDHPDVVRLKREIDGLALGTDDAGTDNERLRQLEDAKSQLAVARQRYSANHIDVQRLEKQVAALSVPAVATGASADGSVSADHPDNPAYIQLNAQREAAVNERTALQRKRSDLVARLGELEGRLAGTPGVEKDYMALVRDLDGAQIKYREVRQKQMEAQLAQSLEVERKGERFELIDPPVAPEEPASPNRRLILVLGSVLAVALAAGIAILLESSDHSVRSRKDITSLLSVPPLAVIPWLENDAQQAARRRQYRYALFGSLATMVAAVSAVHVFYRPLDVLWAVAMRRLTG
jgi:uncharacterized protein involved in exopolysaccharide biosynthesis